MKTTNKTYQIIAFVIVIVLFLLLGGGAMTGARLSGGMMGGISWMWIPTVIVLGLGIFLGWAIFGKK